jgi:hypothetical protein
VVHTAETSSQADLRARPILVTGSHRSGSTWVGRVLAAAPGAVYVDEPFNPMNPLGVSALAEGGVWFRYISAANEAEYIPKMKRVLSFDEPWSRLWWAQDHAPWPKDVVRKHGKPFIVRRYIKNLGYRLLNKRPILKDPIAIMSAEWLARTFNVQVVMMMRHPAAFVLSVKEKKWFFRYENFASQPALMADLLAPFAAEIDRFTSRGEDYDIIEGGSLQWRIIYHVAKRFMDANPSWIGMRHEDLSRDPAPMYRSMFERLNLDFTPAVEKEIAERSSEDNPLDGKSGELEKAKRNSKAIVEKWKTRLSAEEIKRIREATEDIAHHWYSDQDW